MRKFATTAAALALIFAAGPGAADLPIGAKAPAFTAQGALGGKRFAFNLRAALRKGPVVLYFYPKAFTQGCTLEAKAFADASEDFRKAGASVIGVSADDLPTLERFSKEACRGKFAVLAATPAIISAYDVDLKREGASTGLTTRTSYVIAKDGRIKFVHANMDYKDHVRLTLEAVRALSRPAKR